MMKMILILLSLLMSCCAFAEEEIEVDMTPIYQFAEQYSAEEQVQFIYESALGDAQETNTYWLSWVKDQLKEPFENALQTCAQIFPIVLISALIGIVLPTGQGSSGALQFLLRLCMLLGFAQMGMDALAVIEDCVRAAKILVDRIAPILTAVLTALGLERSVALASPLAVQAGNLAEQLFLKYGIPLCRSALCVALAGNLNGYIQLKRVQALIKRVVNWGIGIVVTIFTAFLALQTNVAENLDGIAIRTAKYAVDSASSVIGNGISDVWDSYLYGLMATKSAVGLSGIVAMLFAAAKPILISLSMMAALNLTAAILEAFGERHSAEAAEQIAGVCQMALAICTATLAITIILLGTMMKMGQIAIA